jgi:hypothetical protein
MFILVNKKTKKSGVFKDKTQLSEHLNVHRNTIGNWFKESDYKETKCYIVSIPETIEIISNRGCNNF